MTLLKELRKAKGLTQSDIADKINITRGAYANIENGMREPDYKTTCILADLFGVSVDYLMGRESKKEASPSENELAPLLQEPLMKEIYDTALQLSPEARKIILAQIEAVKDLEAGIKK